MEELKTTKPLEEITEDDDELTVIGARYSVRSYLDKAIPDEILEQLQATINEVSNMEAPMGVKAKFTLIRKELGSTATYGFVSSCQNWITGFPEKGEFDIEGFAYLFERIVFKATRLGLGTVWLGGSFRTKFFTPEIEGFGDDDKLYAVSPVGYAKSSSGLIGGAIRVNSRNRHKWENIFFKDEIGKPLPKEDAGPYTDCLLSIRTAPSAKNQQCTRVVMTVSEDGKRQFHFYHNKKKKIYDRLDAGIILAHWDVVLPEGQEGRWMIEEPVDVDRNSQHGYVCSWAEV